MRHISAVAQVYNTCRNVFPEAPYWPDMKFYMRRHDPDYIFHEKVSETLAEAQKERDLATRGFLLTVRGIMPDKGDEETTRFGLLDNVKRNRGRSYMDEFFSERVTLERESGAFMRTE